MALSWQASRVRLERLQKEVKSPATDERKPLQALLRRMIQENPDLKKVPIYKTVCRAAKVDLVTGT